MHAALALLLLLPGALGLANLTNTIYKGLEEPSLCGSCRIREAVRSRSLEVIKQQILLRLGMPAALNTTGRALPHVPQEVLAQYPSLGAAPPMQADQPLPGARQRYHFTDEEDTMHIKTENILLFSKPYPKVRHSQRHGHVLFFQLSENVTRHRVKRATLYVWLRGARGAARDVLLRVLRVARGGAELPRAAASARQPDGAGRWLKLDATVMLSEWFKNPKDNLGFVLNASTADGDSLLLSDTDKHAPFVDVEITDTRRRRTKRTVGLNCNEDEQQTLCCRYPLTVDFEEFGWDFIIAPKRYEANYCAGECPFMTFQKYAHTHLVKMTNPDSTGPCCAPRKFSAISMLYFDQEYNIIYGSLPGMVVDRCGCS